MTRAIACSLLLVMGIAPLASAQTPDPYFQGGGQSVSASRNRSAATGAGSTGAGSTGAGSTGAGSTGAGSTGAGSNSAGGSSQPPAGVHFYPARTFEIPVQPPTAGTGGANSPQLREYRLFVSANGGRQWQLYRRALPDAKQIPFACRNDGEYWFALYTVDERNASYPTPSTFEPNLRMRVDTQRPELQGEVVPSPTGGVELSWLAQDPNLDPSSFQVVFRPKVTVGRPGAWQSLELPALEAVDSTRLEDRVTVWPDTNHRQIEVQFLVKDWAGNQASVVREVAVPLVAQQPRDRLAQEGLGAGSRNELASGERIASTEPESQVWHSGKPLSGDGASGLAGGSTERGDFTSGGGAFIPNAREGLPAGEASTSQVLESSSEDGASSASVSGVGGRTDTGAMSEAWSSSVPQGRQVESQSEDAGRFVGGASEGSGRALLPNDTSGLASDTEADSSSWSPEGVGGIGQGVSVGGGDREGVHIARGSSDVGPSELEELPPPQSFDQPLVQPRTDSSGREDDGGPFQSISLLDAASGVPAGEVARLTRDASFRMSYEVESVGRAGVAKVQLWITQDGGRSWQIWSEDADCASPIAVQVPEEGLYGFHLVVTARNGLAGEEPRPGDLADMWVEVDRTAPRARLTEAPLGEYDQEGELLIRWEAEDRNLGRRPVTLYYSRSAAGPWNVVAAGVPNTGQYDWRIVPSLPRQLFLKLEVRDRAGNVTSDTLKYPVDLSSLSPRAKFGGLVPADQ